MVTPPYIPAVDAIKFKTIGSVGIYWRLELPEDVLRLWMGINPCPIGIPSVDTEGTEYIGAGMLLSVPDLEILINGMADRVNFSLSGVPASIVSQVDEETPSVKGALCHVGIAPLDSNWQPLTQIIPLWFGIADFWAVQMEPAFGVERPATRTMILSVGSGATGRSRPRRVSFTDSQQKLQYPTDDFFDRVAKYSQYHVLGWPHF